MTGACGTVAGYNRHQRAKTLPCRPCLDALAVYVRARTVRIGKSKTLPIPIGVLAALLRGPEAWRLRRELGDGVCEAILARFPLRGAA